MRPHCGTLPAIAALTFGILLIYLLRVNSVAGLMLDDAWYLLLGKSLAV